MAGEPKIYTKNYLNADCVVTYTSGDSSGVNLYDWDDSVPYLSVGSNDATTETLDITFREGPSTSDVTRALDRLILLNHNVKSWDLHKYNSGAWDLVDAQTAIAASHSIVSFTEFSDTRVRVELKTAQTTNAQKSVGQLILCNHTLTFTDDLAEYSESWREDVRILKLADGSEDRAYARRTAGRVGLYGCQWSVSCASTAFRDSLLAIKESGEPFIWEPESTQDAGRMYFVHWASAWDARYTSSYKGAGWTIRATFNEV